MLTAIRQWVIKTMVKNNTGVVQTLPKREIIELNTQITAERLMRSGINPESLKNVNQVENAVNAIDNTPRVIPATSKEGQGITEKLFGKRGEVFDMQGNKLDSNKSIMAGTQIDEKSLKEGLMKTDNPFSDLVKTTKQKPKTLKEREAEVLAGMEKNNKEAVQRIRNRKMVKDAVDNASPGFVSGDRKYNAQLVADDLADKRFNKDFFDLDQKQQSDIYSEALDGLDDVDKFATGGRAGFKGGYLASGAKQLGKKYKGSTLSAILENPKLLGAELGHDGIMEVMRLLPSLFADGGRIGLKGGSGFLKFLKKFKVKQSGDDVKEFLSKRQFMKDIVGNTEKNRKARQLAELKEAMEEARKNPGFKFPSGKELRTDIEKEIAPILLKDRKLNATGGRIGYRDGPKIKVQASGSKTGKNQIEGAPEGITYDSESIDAIIKADIPISQKIDLLADYQYGKGRTRIDNKDQEIYMDEGGYKNRNVGLGFNQDGEGFSGTVMRNLETGDDDFRIRFKKSFADGGRIGLRSGMTKRAFLKLMGSVGATIGAAKSGIFTGLGKGAGKQVAKEVVQQSTSTPPPYFFKLAEKIKMMGDDVTATTERTMAKKLPSKDGKSEYLLEEDMVTGDTSIKKIYKEDDNMITDVEIMEFRKGEDVITKDGKAIKTPDEYEEVTEVNKRIYKDDYNASDYSDGINVDAIIKEVDDTTPSIKKAGGGIARMLGE